MRNDESVTRNNQYWEQLIYDAYCELETDGILQLGTTIRTKDDDENDDENDTNHMMSYENHNHNNPIIQLSAMELWDRTQAAAHRVALERHVSRNIQGKNRNRNNINNNNYSNNTSHHATTTNTTKSNHDPAILGSVPWTGIAASMLNGWLAAVGCSDNSILDITDQDNHHSGEQPQQRRVRYAEELFRIATMGNDSVVTRHTAGKTKLRNNHSKPYKNVVGHTIKNVTSSTTVEPDLVTYSLLYTLLYPTDPILAEWYLQLAQRQSKKVAGTQRRKLLSKVSSAVRPPTIGGVTAIFRDYENELRTLFCSSSTDTTTTLTDQPNDSNDPLILYENENYVVLNKPSGTCCYHTHTTTAGKRNVDVSVVDAFQKFRNSHSSSLSTLNPAALGIVHRLDRGTSGCLILAKNDPTHARFVSAMFQRQLRKTYTVLVSPAPCIQLYHATTGYITIPVNGKPAKSKYTIIERFIRYNNSSHTNETAALMNVTTYTGRQHQVRVHCSYGLGTPIIGDTLYSQILTTRANTNTPKRMKMPNSHTSTKTLSQIDNDPAMQQFHLHATTIALPIQFEEKKCTTTSMTPTNATDQKTTAQSNTILYEAPIPTWWQPVLDEWRQQHI